MSDRLPPLSTDQLRLALTAALSACGGSFRRVLLIHPDYSRNDFSHLVAPLLHDLLRERGLERIDGLNASGTHRPMSQAELRGKLGLDSARHPRVGTLFNHEFDRPDHLLTPGTIPAEFVAEKTAGHLRQPLPITVNRLVAEDHDLIVALSGTLPHEALGYSGGTKILFPGISGPEVIGLLHWAAVLVGIPRIIGSLDNPARDIVNAGADKIFAMLGGRPILSLDMVYTEDEHHRAVPRGLFWGVGPAGFASALTEAAGLSSRLHLVYLVEPLRVAVQNIPPRYDEVWTAGKGSYKLQKPGVLADGAEVILYAPHIDAFHSKPEMDADIRRIGYHGRDYVADYCRRHPGFDRNIASHVINVRGIGELAGGAERFGFRVTLASRISERDCAAVGLGYRDPDTVRRDEFAGPGRLWIEEGGQWLYSRR
ncbi:MAG: lactate racemase domain-containing protein [Gemmataceae bacterium]